MAHFCDLSDPALRAARSDSQDLAGRKSEMRASMARFLCASILIIGTAVFLRAHSRGEVFPPRQSLSSFPEQLGDWTGTDLTMDKDTLQVLGPGDFLLRSYNREDGSVPYLGLFIAYFPSQRSGDTIHSPKNCLPGAGWAPIESSRIDLTVPGQSSFPVNRYVIAKGA